MSNAFVRKYYHFNDSKIVIRAASSGLISLNRLGNKIRLEKGVDVICMSCTLLFDRNIVSPPSKTTRKMDNTTSPIESRGVATTHRLPKSALPFDVTKDWQVTYRLLECSFQSAPGTGVGNNIHGAHSSPTSLLSRGV